MPGCNLDYIPDRLHWNAKPLITQFAVGDLIYRRIAPDEFENPFASVSLTDLSHNIGINQGNELSIEDDVLLSISEMDEIKYYKGKCTCTLEIKSLNTDNCYLKPFAFRNNNNDLFDATMELVHKPEECMYPHCVFKITMNNVEVTFTNYRQTLGQKKLAKLRTLIREELVAMIRRKAIEQTPT